MGSNDKQRVNLQELKPMTAWLDTVKLMVQTLERT